MLSSDRRSGPIERGIKLGGLGYIRAQGSRVAGLHANREVLQPPLSGTPHLASV